MQKKKVKTCLSWEIFLPYIIEAFYPWFQFLALVNVILNLHFFNWKPQMESDLLADYPFKGHTPFFEKCIANHA